jgi:RimJ/RimL family protein N-acetyltransferase
MKVILQDRTNEHVVIFFEKTQDEEIQKLFPFSIKSLEEALKLYEESLKDGAVSYGKVIYYEGKYVGDIWCYCIDEIDEKMAMMSIVIFEKELWGKGIGAQASIEFIKEVFNKYDIDKIGAFTYSLNNRSIGLLEKIGFNSIETFIEDGISSKYLEINKI